MRQLLNRLIPRTTGGCWAAAGGTAVLAALAFFLAFFVFGFHLIFVDEVVDEEAPEFAVALGETDIDDLISAAVAGGDSSALAEQRESLQAGMDRMREEALADGSDDAMGVMYGELDIMREGVARLAAAEEQMLGPDEAAQLAAEREREKAEMMGAAEAMAADEGAVRVAAVGSFISRSHPSSGTAAVLTDGTQTFLRFDDDFATDNGPDLNVYLSAARPNDSVGDLGSDFIDLGDMKGNIGAQNYEVPAGTDLDRYRTVVIWCVRFSVAFGAAELAPVG